MFFLNRGHRGAVIDRILNKLGRRFAPNASWRGSNFGEASRSPAAHHGESKSARRPPPRAIRPKAAEKGWPTMRRGEVRGNFVKNRLHQNLEGA